MCPPLHGMGRVPTPARTNRYLSAHPRSPGRSTQCCRLPCHRLHVRTWVFGEAKNTNFLKIFLQYVKHVDARSNKEQFINKLLHAYRITCRSLPEIFCWFSVLSRKAQVRSKSFRSLLEYLMNPFSSFSIHLFAFEPHSNPLI